MTVRTAAFANLIPRSSSQVGPFQYLRMLNKGSFGTAYIAREIPTGHVFCAKVSTKRPSKRERETHLRGLTAELLAYKRIATAEPHTKKWIMDIHGVLQTAKEVVFAMVRSDCSLHCFHVTEWPVGRHGDGLVLIHRCDESTQTCCMVGRSDRTYDRHYPVFITEP